MFVYLIRHGIAVDNRDGFSDDAQRPLSEDGVRRMEVQAATLARIGTHFDEIWTSPQPRARQTADILVGSQPHEPPVIEEPRLAPQGDLAAIIDRLRNAGDDHCLALVGHEVGIVELASRLLVGRTLPFMRFSCGTVCCLEIVALDPIVRALLHWHMTPMQQRGLM